MGYRELLKKYIRFVEEHAGDHFIDSIGYSSNPASPIVNWANCAQWSATFEDGGERNYVWPDAELQL